MKIAGVSAPRPARRSRQGVSEPGAEASLEKIPTGNGQDGPAMRPKHPHAAESGVGKHTARESERAQACATGKERVANAHSHKLASEAAKLPGPFCFSNP